MDGLAVLLEAGGSEPALDGDEVAFADVFGDCPGFLGVRMHARDSDNGLSMCRGERVRLGMHRTARALA